MSRYGKPFETEDPQNYDGVKVVIFCLRTTKLVRRESYNKRGTMLGRRNLDHEATPTCVDGRSDGSMC